jgi:VanZ family protein
MQKRTLRILLAMIPLIISFAVIFVFTSINGEESNHMSRQVARYIENLTAKHFRINRSDEFWSVTLNAIVRKCGHLLEFALAGLSSCVFFVVLLRRKWAAAPVSLFLCILLAVSDEFRQRFVTGRSPRWFDIKIDIAGAVFGIAAAFIVYLLYARIKSLKGRIRELEGGGRAAPPQKWMKN